MKMLTLPGLIDIHVHFRDPGQTAKEDFTTGTQAALAGGFTTVFDMPNNKIPITTKERLDEKVKIAREKVVCDVGLYFGSLGDNLDEFENVRNSVWALKLYLNETTGNFLISKEKLEDIFTAWKGTGKPILLHAEDDAVDAVIQIVKKTKRPAHFCHISLQSDLEQIMHAKEDGLPITCGVTPHHLFLTQEDAQKLGAFGKMKPYLKSQKDVDFLWENLKYIDAVESDHAPHTIEEKSDDNPPFGVPNLETMLPLLLTAVSENKLTIEDVKRLCFEGPKNIVHAPTDENTSVEVDMDEEYEITRDMLYTKCGWSPFEGRTMRGRVKKVILHGKTVFENGEIVVKPGNGTVILPA